MRTLLPVSGDRLPPHIRQTLRLVESLYDEALACSEPPLAPEHLDLLERRLAEIRLLLEATAKPASQPSTPTSPEPWSYDYSPYRRNDGREIPAFEVYDASSDKVFDTNEDSHAEVQEANARSAAAAPSLRSALCDCVRLLADFEGDDGEEGRAYRNGKEALNASGTGVR